MQPQPWSEHVLHRRLVRKEKPTVDQVAELSHSLGASLGGSGEVLCGFGGLRFVFSGFCASSCRALAVEAIPD